MSLATTPSPRLDLDDADVAALLDEEDDPDNEEPEGDGRLVRRRRHSREVELFAGTSVVWQRTDDGTPFVACGDRYVYVLRLPEGWTVAECPTYTCSGSRMVASGLPAQDALEVAAEHAEQTGKVLAARSASWRRSAPTDGQLRHAAELGIDPTGMRRGDLSAAIDLINATSTLRPAAQWAAAQHDRGEVSA